MRRCLEGILWVLRSGARWKDLPRSFPSYVTCWRRFVEWSDDGVWDQAWRRLVDQLDRQGHVDWEEGFADGTFASAKKGAISSVRPSGARAPSSCAWSTAPACRWPSTSTCASPAEVTLIEPLLDQAVTPYVPSRLIYDRAADSDPLRERLAARDVELICPHRKGRVRPATQDGRPLRRYRKRWIIERTITWLQSFRRLVTRYEFYSFLFHSFAKLACLMIVLRRF